MREKNQPIRLNCSGSVRTFFCLWLDLLMNWLRMFFVGLKIGKKRRTILKKVLKKVRSWKPAEQFWPLTSLKSFVVHMLLHRAIASTQKQYFMCSFSKIWHKIYFSIIAFRMKIRSLYQTNENEKQQEEKNNNNEKKTERDHRTCQAFFYRYRWNAPLFTSHSSMITLFSPSYLAL